MNHYITKRKSPITCLNDYRPVAPTLVMMKCHSTTATPSSNLQMTPLLYGLSPGSMNSSSGTAGSVVHRQPKQDQGNRLDFRKKKTDDKPLQTGLSGESDRLLLTGSSHHGGLVLGCEHSRADNEGSAEN